MLLKFNGSRRRRSISTGVLMTLAGAFVWTTVYAANPGTLDGTVVDSEGAVIWMAHVLVRPDLTGRKGIGPKQQTYRTGRDGQFSAQLEPGFYDVCVMADAFIPTCQKISIEPAKKVEPRFQLGIALDVIKGVADTFPTAKQPR